MSKFNTVSIAVGDIQVQLSGSRNLERKALKLFHKLLVARLKYSELFADYYCEEEEVPDIKPDNCTIMYA